MHISNLDGVYFVECSRGHAAGGVVGSAVCPMPTYASPLAAFAAIIMADESIECFVCEAERWEAYPPPPPHEQYPHPPPREPIPEDGDDLTAFALAMVRAMNRAAR